MKKKVMALVLLALMVTGLVGCGSDNNASKSEEGKLKVGMVTDTGTIDDKSFNQGTWEGIKEAEKSFGLETTFMQPNGESESSYLTEIQNLYDSGYKFIVTPGYKFETAIYKAQSQYEDAKFILIDGEPNDGNDNYLVADNTVAVYFAEEQSGFIAGVASAVQLQDGDFGFIGGMEIPSVKKFNYGFQQGVAYANEHYGTNVSLKAENIVYSGSFSDTALGQQLSAQMYDNGVKAIFTAAAGVNIGVITEAKTRVANGQEAWVIGVDSDQYDDGIYEGNKSVVLTSAIKKIDEAAYQIIEDEINGEFPGGQVLRFDAKNDAVGIPSENPNLSDDTIAKVNEVIDAIKADKIEVKTEL
ncbi:BMP family lipoprotein [Clostridium saudiense]|uniref:BMP family lipoprotein n=1 Tax=Clostridium saudiense TaxID=1414720 RepID=UPI0018A900B4|nr:BMP family ABC transporter substrate-binding protein [Clostridium saudiense]